MKGIVVSCPIVSDFNMYRSFSPDDTITRLILPEIPLTLTDYNGKIWVQKNNHLKNDLEGHEEDDEFAPTQLKEIEVPQELVDFALAEFEACEKFRVEQQERQVKFTEAFRSLENVEFPESWITEKLKSLHPQEEYDNNTLSQMKYFREPIKVSRAADDSRPWWKFW